MKLVSGFSLALPRLLAGVIAILASLAPAAAKACACGCGVFNLGLPVDMPNSFFKSAISLRYSYMNQDETLHGASRVSNDLNPDKQIDTRFFSLDLQHRFNRDWSIVAMIPYWERRFTTDANGTPGVIDATPQLLSAKSKTLSDIRVMGTYSGFSEDMSIGLTFGLKLPTGPIHAGNAEAGEPIMDRDTQPGTGTTDTLLGGYLLGNGRDWGWFIQGIWDHALARREGYKPGDSVDLAAGVHYDDYAARSHLVPTLQLIAQWRGHDQGGGDAAFGNADSGYTNVYLTPGVQANLNRQWLLNASAYLPVYRYVNGYQQVAHWLGNIGVTYLF